MRELGQAAETVHEAGGTGTLVRPGDEDTCPGFGAGRANAAGACPDELASEPWPIGLTTAPPRPAVPPWARRAGQLTWQAARSAWQRDATLLIPAAVTLAVILWGLTKPSYWGDEADSVSAASRTLPQLMHMLRHVDAVHGFYYLILWPVVQLLGPGEFATRLPSALAMAAAAAGTAAIGRRLVSGRAGLCAGLLFAAVPTVTIQGQDARPYAMLTAAAVLTSYLFVRAADDPSPRRFAAYGASLLFTGYMHLFGMLLIPAHALTLAWLARRRAAEQAGAAWRRWLVTAGAASALVAPVAIYGWHQRYQIDWIPTPSLHGLTDLIGSLTGGSSASTAVVVALCGYGIFHAHRASASGARERSLAWLALPWLLVPPALLWIASEVKPVFYARYLVFCLPAVALLAGAGLAALAGWARLAAFGLIVAMVLPMQLSFRDQGGGMQAAAAVVGEHQRPGDGLIFPGNGIPPWNLAYPATLGRLRNVGQKETAAATGRLYGVRVPVPVLLQRELKLHRIWVITMGLNQLSPAPYLAPGFRLVHEWTLHTVTLRLYDRNAA